MTKEEIDTLWQKAMQESIKDGEMFTRYHFAELVEDKVLAEHAMRETQRLGQEIEPDDIASILACRDILDAQPVPPRTWVGSGDLEDSNAYLTPSQRKPLTFAGQSISEIRLANGLIARLVKDILIVEFD